MTAQSSLPDLSTLSDLELAQAIALRLAIKPNDWHRLNRNRLVRSQEQTAAALVYLLKGETNEALPRLQQAIGWLEQTVHPAPCPAHGSKK
jgi:hypothetical protein